MGQNENEKVTLLNGDSVRRLASEKQLTMREISQRLSLSLPMLSRLLNEKIKPRQQTIYALAKALEIEGTVVWEGEIPFPPPPPPERSEFGELLALAMRSGIGKTLHNDIAFIRDDGLPWLSKQLGSILQVSDSTLSSWRTGRSRPSHANFERLLRTLFADHPQLKEWRDAFVVAYNDEGNLLDGTARQIPEVPSQSTKAISFGVDQGKVRLDPNHPNQNEIDEHFKFFHDEALEATQAMISDVPTSSNELGELRDTLSRYLEALGANPENANRPLVWREGRRLRRFLNVEKQKEAGAFTNVSAMSAEHFWPA